MRNYVFAASPAPHDQDRVRHGGLEGEGSAKRAERKNAAGTESRPAVDDDEAEILRERWILKAVIHDDRIGGQRFEEPCSGGPVPAHGRGRRRGQQQRLVAHARGIVDADVDRMRAALASAIAAREKGRAAARLAKQGGELQRNRRLARAAHGEIADANDGQLAAVGDSLPEALLNLRAIKSPRWAKAPRRQGESGPAYHQEGGSSRMSGRFLRRRGGRLGLRADRA